ncbi:uncharacterized protein [Apostichopus japonicus]|uniref:uncharacterized protein isoform X2 n=1 Tax=Stichopus japonicus TaxID=307972 RepID=UPI003AB4DE21
MAANGFPRAGRSGRTPHVLTVGLLVVICILAFNYWNVSLQNKIHQKERAEMTRNLEELALRRVHLEKRCEALDGQLQDNNRELQTITSDKNSCLMSLRETGEERDSFKNRLLESDAEFRELRMQVEDSNATLDRQKGELQAVLLEKKDAQQELAIKDNTIYNLENVMKEMEERLSAADDEIRRLQFQVQQPQQRRQPFNAIPPQRDVNGQPPIQFQPQQPALSGYQQQQQQQQQQQPGQQQQMLIPGQEKAAELPSNKFAVPNIPQVQNLYLRNQEQMKFPEFNPNAQLDRGVGVKLPNIPDDQPQIVQNNQGDDTLVNVRIEDNPVEGNNLPFDNNQPGDDKIQPDQEAIQEGLNKDPGMVNQLEDEENRNGDDTVLLGEGDKENEDAIDREGFGQDESNQDQQVDNHPGNDGLNNMDSESGGPEDKDNPDGGIEDGQPSVGEEDFDKDEIHKEGGVLQVPPAIQEDEKLRFEPGNQENQLNPNPNYD